jgi:hypothetical protein
MPRLSLALSAFLVLAVLSVFTVVAVMTDHASAAVPTQEIKPGALPRGADVAIPHLEGRTVVDGDVRIPVKGAVVRLLGKSGTTYVVSTMNQHGTSSRILRFAADGTRTVIARGEVFESQLSSDGLSVFATKYRSKHSTLTAWTVATGQVAATKRFAGYPTVLDALGDRVLLGSWGRGTFSWDLATGSVLRLTKRVGGAASLEEDLLASYTTDPYTGGCMVVSRISETGDQLWKSCTERVESFAPGGRRMVTVHILSDGIGPSAASVRTLGGRLLGRYSVQGWFGALSFESPKALLLEVNGKRQATTARCVREDCERAADLAPVQPPRAG